jgi:hypothetical protein
MRRPPVSGKGFGIALRIGSSLLAVLLLGCCAVAGNNTSATPTGALPNASPISSTVGPDLTTPVVSPPAPGASPAPDVTRVLTGTGIEITPAMAGQVVQVPAGRVFLVNLHSDERWTLSWIPQDAVRSWLASYQPRGSQGYYSIDVPGSRAVLTATRTAACATAAAGQSCTPAAADLVTVTVVAGPTERP